MSKRKLCSRRMLAVALSAAMMFASVDVSVLAAGGIGEIGDIGVVTNQVNEGQPEENDGAGDSGSSVIQDGSNESGESGEQDNTTDSGAQDTPGNTDGPGGEEAAGGDTASGSENISGGDAASGSENISGGDTVSGSEDASGKDTESDGEGTSGEDDKLGSEETPGEDSSDMEQQEDELENDIAADEADLNKEEIWDDGMELTEASDKLRASGKINNITYELYDDGRLEITGTGDYLRDGFENPPWVNEYQNSIKSAVVKITGITSTKNMFYNCRYLETVDLTGLDTSKVTDMSGMFAVGGDFHTFDSENTVSTIIVYGSLQSLDLSMLDTSNVTNMNRMFSHCGDLRKLNISGWNTSKVTDMGEMFEFCPHLELTAQDLENIDTPNVRNMSRMFKYYAYNRRNLAAVDTLDLSAFNTSGVRDMSGMFEYCSNIHFLNISGFDTGNVIDMSRMFYNCVNIESMDTSGFDTSNVRNMNYMFYGCRRADVSNFDTSNVTDMSYMFANSSIGWAYYDKLDVSGFDTSKVTNMNSMFLNADRYTTNIDVSNFDTSNVTDMSNMFSGCTKLESLDLSSFNTVNTTQMGNFLKDCKSLRSLDLSSFDMSNTATFTYISELSGLSYICTPRNCHFTLSLPEGKWYRDDGTECSELPIDSPDSIILYKGGYPADDAGETKQVLFLSGITIANKEYDGEPFSYTGTAQIKDWEGNEISGAEVSAVYYSGTLTDGSEYEKSTQAPISAGSYTLTFEVSGIDENSYILSKNSYKFRINRRIVTITAPSVEVAIGGTVPELNTLTEQVKLNGLLGNTTLAEEPMLKYSQSAESIPVNKDGSYDIIPYGAALKDEDTGNYSIKYIRGKLKVGAPEEEEEIILSGSIKNISWKLDVAGKLTLEGSGEYATLNETAYNEVVELPWTADNVRSKVLSAEVKISDITRAQCMFYDCSNLKSVDLSGLDKSNITHTYYMFKGCTALESLDLSGFGAGKIRVMNGMFAGCSSLKDIDLSGFNTSGVVRMEGLFSGCSSLESLDLSGFDTSKVERMGSWGAVDASKTSIYGDGKGGMFSGCVKLRNLDLSNFNTSSVKNMEYMFYGCKGLSTLDLSNFNTSSAENMEYMFAGCSALPVLNLRGFNTVSVNYMTGMFENCKNLRQLDLNSFNTRNVYNMDRMFAGCSALTDLNLSSFSSDNVESMSGMFQDCAALKTLDLSSLSSYGNADDSYFMLPRDMSSMFAGCSSLVELDLSGFNTDYVTDMHNMFLNCRSLEKLDLSSFGRRGAKNTSMAEFNMNGMFSGCESLKDLRLSGFNTDAITDMGSMFLGCSNLQSLDLSGFNTDSVVDMSNMFAGCVTLIDVNLSSFSTDSVTDMSKMLSGCVALTDVNLSSFNTAKVTNMSSMFSGCSALTSLDLRSFDMSRAGDADGADLSDMLNNCNALSYILTPKNCSGIVNLPVSESTDKWSDENKTAYTQLPQGLNRSIILYKNAYLEGENGGVKQIAFISGINIKNKVYDGKADSYTGTVVATDLEGKALENLVFSYIYAGTLADNTLCPESAEAPSQAGEYTLSVKITGENADKYVLNRDTFKFSISRKEITITAPTIRIETGDEAPELTDLTCTVSGLLEEDKQEETETALAGALLKYNVDKQDIDVTKPGRYYIVPYGVDSVLTGLLANNYTIKYEMGILYVGDDGNAGDTTGNIDLSSQELGAVISNIKAKTYDGYAYEPAIKVTVIENRKKKTLTEGMDYDVSYRNNVNAGTGTVIVTGCGDYKGELSKTFTIKPKSVKKLKYIIGSMSVGDDSSNPPIYVYDGAKLLTRGNDYTLSETANLTSQASKGVTITVDGSAPSANYTGVKKIKMPVYDGDVSKIIKPSDIYWKTDDVNGGSLISLLAEEHSQTYTGKALKPEVIVKIGDVTLVPKKDYKVQYQNNKNAGTAYVIITGKGEYKGKVVTTFEITPLDISAAVQNLEIKAIADKTYNAKLQKPSVKVKADGKTLRKNKDYTLSYSNNLYVSTESRKATVTVNGRGNYCGSASQTFIIKPQNIKKVSVKGTFEGTGDKKLTVTYAKRTLKEGYDYIIEEGERKNNKITITIRGKEDSNFTGSVTKKVKIK